MLTVFYYFLGHSTTKQSLRPFDRCNFSSENYLHKDRRLAQNVFGFWEGLLQKTREMLPFLCLPPFDVDFFFEKLRTLLRRHFSGRMFGEEL